MATETTKNEQKEAQGNAKKDNLQNIDYKMISFTLAGKDYGINILRVKEIRKAGNFTFVPNTPAFVLGVDNLRGDIIPIIDLRIMFNLPAPKKAENELENIIILRLDELIIGIVVDTIEKVVGINSSTIQPPHPIFGDINIKYISGVVENQGKLYILLDANRIFEQEKDEPSSTSPAASMDEPEEEKPHLSQDVAPKTNEEEININFILETLATFANFHVTKLNERWIVDHYSDWQKKRSQSKKSVQLESKEDAEALLQGFFSRFNNQVWPPSYAHGLVDKLDIQGNGPIQVWNPGCGSGVETYSLLMALKTKFPKRQIKVFANDNDLLSISNAPNLSLPDPSGYPEWADYVVKGKNGYSLKTELKNLILFEFHDIAHMNPFYGLDLIVARDVLSFLKESQQVKVMEDFHEKLKKGGSLVLGDHEVAVDYSLWNIIEEDGYRLFRKN
jgi:purine-binding chemotaxis protein CheW